MAKPQIFITHAGKTLPLSGWARETGIPVTVLRWRYFDEWPAARMLTEKPAAKTKVTPAQVAQIRERRRRGTARAVAAEYGLTPRHVCAIWRGAAWK
ncbi:hypothetical protein WMF38_57675 [Sorangium sp. So ce118]